MTVVRGSERPVAFRGEGLPTLQRLVDREAGSSAMTVLVNEFRADQQVPTHSHEVEEVLVVTQGTCRFQVGEVTITASEGDAVIVPPHTAHGIAHVGHGQATVVAVLASADVVVASFPR